MTCFFWESRPLENARWVGHQHTIFRYSMIKLDPKKLRCEWWYTEALEIAKEGSARAGRQGIIKQYYTVQSEDPANLGETNTHCSPAPRWPRSSQQLSTQLSGTWHLLSTTKFPWHLRCQKTWRFFFQWFFQKRETDAVPRLLWQSIHRPTSENHMYFASEKPTTTAVVTPPSHGLHLPPPVPGHP